jgi:excisionase family DNA binding protein
MKHTTATAAETSATNNTEVAYFDRLQLAQFLGVSARTIDQWRATGVLPHIKVGRVIRFPRKGVEAAMTRFTRQARA